MKLVRVNFSIFPFWSKCVKLTKKVGKRPSIVELELGVSSSLRALYDDLEATQYVSYSQGKGM